LTSRRRGRTYLAVLSLDALRRQAATLPIAERLFSMRFTRSAVARRALAAADSVIERESEAS
jgi:hypothetical protein